LEQAQWKNIINYTDKQISDTDLNIIIEAGLYAPHGGNIENDIFFTIVQSKNMLNKINTMAKEFAQHSEISVLKNLGDDENFNFLYNAKTLMILSYKKRSVGATYDCFSVTQNILLASESIGLGSCWLYFPLQAFKTEYGEELLKELKVPEDYEPITSIIIGYKENNKTEIPERKTENIIYVR
jgi:nitroreductase